MNRIGGVGAAFLCGSLWAGAALAQAAPGKAAAQAQIWAKEQDIYGHRAAGDLSHYIDETAADYAAWPPGRAAPLDGAALRKDAAAMVGKTGERLTLTFADFRLSGATGVIYYTTHMTSRSDGAPVDLYYENIHVWIREGDDWRLLGGMARLRSPPKPAP